MWLPLLIHNFMLWERRWCYDRSCFIRNNILTFICISCRNYYSICLNYTGYNFKQIDNKKHICNLSIWCVFYTYSRQPRLWFFISYIYYTQIIWICQMNLKNMLTRYLVSKFSGVLFTTTEKLSFSSTDICVHCSSLNTHQMSISIRKL